MRKIIEQKPSVTDSMIRSLLDRIDHDESPVRIRGLQGSATAFMVSALFSHLSRTVVLVCPTEKEAKTLHRDMGFFLDEDRALLFPSWDVVLTDMFSFQRDVELMRIEGLCRLITAEPAVIVMSAAALTQRLMPRKTFAGYVQTVSIGETLGRDFLVGRLLEGGYTRTTLVEAKGEFSIRGHVVDLYPPTLPRAIRIEFIGDEIESIRDFDPATQRSTGERVDFTLTPAREIILTEAAQAAALRNLKARASELGLAKAVRDRLLEKLGSHLIASVNPLFFSLFGETEGDLDSLFSYLPKDSLLVLDDEVGMARTLENQENEFSRFLLRARAEEKFYLEMESIYLPAETFKKGCESFSRISLEMLPLGVGQDDSVLVLSTTTNLGIRSAAVSRDHADKGILAPAVEAIGSWLKQGYIVTMACAGEGEVSRIINLFEAYGLPVRQAPAGQSFSHVIGRPGDHSLMIREGRISTGFVFDALRLVLIAETDVFGKKVPRRHFRPAREGYFLRSFGELREGDFVVHKDHGIGLYRGLQKLTVEKIENDFLLIEYADNDKLYIPVDRLDMIQRYLGPEGFTPRTERLGGSAWEAMKEKVKKSIREVAEELVAIYAAREIMERSAFAPLDRLYDEFCSLFEFEETPDQARAIEDVHGDMDKSKPMDRLICGDAGFGKTEVALRASFRSVMESKQVAVLVPTTILAEQHYQTFKNRFQNYPIRVEVLNRLKTKAQQKEIVDEINQGKVDIVIGTHRLLQKDIQFRDLGLVVVDEEQRFGVADKERLKKLRTLVDVLTLTATPIPRTLHLSLVGLRDLSIINTPPESRLPIKTYVLEFNEDIIRDAIRQELARGGQVFFLHDRVKSIFTMARFVEKLVPEAKTSVVHGQMRPKDIEDAMVKFVHQETNVLVCTSIISAGVDIPSANTIIINRADRFGLSQLYQIRGRVGRFKEEAFAYLLVPRGAMLSADAQRRLQVIMEFSEPGSGFRIASNDLDIRGAGNLLGLSQSGQVSAVGYELYTELMEKTIQELKGEAVVEEEVKPEINLGIPAFIPAGYMTDEHQRLVSYKRISMAAVDEDLVEIRDELNDCYGFVPQEVDNLFEVIRIRNLMKKVKGRKLGYDGKQFLVAFQSDSPIDPAKILELTRRKNRGIKLTPDYKLYVPAADLKAGEIPRSAYHLLEILMTK
ncbi:MAG: transcription-repair coupling factor [Syntrophales bacterium]|nr:transcription-repair coupling factor [Syntrophales bacterium]